MRFRNSSPGQRQEHVTAIAQLLCGRQVIADGLASEITAGFIVIDFREEHCRYFTNGDARRFTVEGTQIADIGSTTSGSFTCTLSPYRQDELKGCAGVGSARGPYPSRVSFDDRTADR